MKKSGLCPAVGRKCKLKMIGSLKGDILGRIYAIVTL